MTPLKTLERMVETSILTKENYEKLKKIKNKKVFQIIHEYIDLCKPAKVTVITDTVKDIEYVRKRAIEINEECELSMKGHTIHFDAFNTMQDHDQARDKEHTRVLIESGEEISKRINTIDRKKGLGEIRNLLNGCMNGKECLIRFFCLGPLYSKFSILALQITDSFYVAHSEDLLYRSGYELFKNLKDSDDFFYFIHSAGELVGDPPVSKNLDKRRIYIDLNEKSVLSVNNQYAGNSLGLKKLALRLAIHRANNEDWLAEHYFILGVTPIGKNRKTYCAGAYPSGCGKTSTAMLPGQRILGDDIAYLRKWEDGYCHIANIEEGIFGIIRDVNKRDDPVIYDTITTPGEVIFSNVLVHGQKPFWLGMGIDLPNEGINFSGEWHLGKTDGEGTEIPLAHPNARYTVRIEELQNADRELHNPKGVKLQGIFYGGRDSDTMPPIVESLDWAHGVFSGATIESETTAQTLGKVGIRKVNPMANLDFIVVPLGKYINNHLKFGSNLENIPKIYSTNYFLKDKEGNYLNGVLDKLIWVIWAEGRIHGEYKAIKTPIGYIPRYETLKELFQKYLKKEYKPQNYETQFSLRINKLLEKLNRVEEIYKKERSIPEQFWDVLNEQRSNLENLYSLYAKNVILPTDLLNK